MKFRVGWVERLFAKPIIPHEVDGFHYAPKKQALHSTHPTEMLDQFYTGTYEAGETQEKQTIYFPVFRYSFGSH